MKTSEEEYQAEKVQIQETIDRLVGEGNRCEDQITRYQAEMAKAGQQLEIGRYSVSQRGIQHGIYAKYCRALRRVWE